MQSPLALAAVLAVWVSLASASAAYADDPPKPGATPTATPQAAVISDSPGPLLINGLPADKTPAFVPLGSEVCIRNAVHFAGEADRWTFQGWNHGVEDACITVDKVQTYRALHLREVLLHVKSEVTGLRSSQWVPAGNSVPIVVPEIVQTDPRVRYKFKEWSEGDNPFRPQNAIAVLKPTTLEAKWTKQYYVTITGSNGVPLQGSDWYDEGHNLVLQAPAEAAGDLTGERQKFASWESAGVPFIAVPNAQNPITNIKVDNSYNLQATYGREFFVNVITPFGTLKREWMKEGAELPLEAPPMVEVIPDQERFLFQRWEGMEGLFSPKVTGVVSGPLNLRAVYARQLKVTVVSPHGGGGDGWYAPDSTATISVPASVADMLVLKHNFSGFPGQASGGGPTVRVLVREPTVITAVYKTEVDLGVLALLLILPLLAVTLFILHHWLTPLLWARVSIMRLTSGGFQPPFRTQRPAPSRTQSQVPSGLSTSDLPTQELPAPQPGTSSG